MMLHPSYAELIEIANRDVAPGEEPVVLSRYSIIHATAKRAHQIVEGAEPLSEGDEKKPLSLAVKEIAEGQINIVKKDAPSVIMGQALDAAGLYDPNQLIGSTDVTIDASELVGMPQTEYTEYDESDFPRAFSEPEEPKETPQAKKDEENNEEN